MLLRSSENLAIQKNYSPVLLVSTIAFQVVPLGKNAAIPTFFHASVEVLKCACAEHLLRFCLDLLNRVKTTLLQLEFRFGEQEKVAGVAVRRIVGVGNDGLLLEARNCRTTSSES